MKIMNNGLGKKDLSEIDYELHQLESEMYDSNTTTKQIYSAEKSYTVLDKDKVIIIKNFDNAKKE